MPTIGQLMPDPKPPEPRALMVIAEDIRQNWAKPHYAAVPYLEAMDTMLGMQSRYYLDSAKSIVLYFLANAGTWRGEDARRIKAELRSMAGGTS